jgi:YHS domain-containing protein
MNSLMSRGARSLMAGLVFSLVGAASGWAQAVNVDKTGRALAGYDPVAFFTDAQAVKGQPTLHADHAGATYYFATEAHRMAFLAEPKKFLPAFGGYCAWAVSKNDTAKVEIDTWQVTEGRLLLNYDQSIKKKFNQDLKVSLAKADGHWPALEAKLAAKK